MAALANVLASALCLTTTPIAAAPPVEDGGYRMVVCCHADRR